MVAMEKNKLKPLNFSKTMLLRIFLLTISSLLFIFSIWGVFENTSYLKTLIEQGQLDSIGFNYDIIHFYLSSSGQYFLYAILIFVSTFSLPKNNKLENDQNSKLLISQDEQVSQLEKNENDEEIDKWLMEMKKNNHLTL